MTTSGKGRKPLVAERRTGAGRKSAGQRRAPPPKAPKPRRGGLVGLLLWPVRLALRILWWIGLRLGIAGAVALALAVVATALTLDAPGALLDARARGSVTLLDRDGDIYAWRGEQFGGRIDAASVAPVLKNAIVATEDKRFYRHFGVSPRGVASAIRINLREGRGPFSGHGGSTITQQTAKLLCLGVAYDPASGMTEAEYEADCRRTTIARKAREAIYAMAMELRYSKDEILTIYLNRAYLGAGSRGFEAAAQRYFGKSANQVDAAEAAMLAGLLVAPSRFAPTANLQRSRDRANLIVGLMEDQGYLTAAEADAARSNPARLSQAAEARAGGYYADWVMDQGPSFLTDQTTEDVVIRTTFDPRIQQAAEDALEWVFENKVRAGSEAQAAIVVMSADGAVRAMVGGRKLRGVAGQFNRAIQAKRQTGSAFKPFVFAAALDEGYSPWDWIVDEPITFDVPGSGPWSPRNYTNDYSGRVSLTEALARSLNIPAVRVSEFIGRDRVIEIADGFGVGGDLADVPAVALGVSESTLLEMTAAYAGILNGGSAVEPYGLIELRLKGETASLIDQTGGMGDRVISEDAARQLVWMMSQVIERGTGTRARLPDRPAAGKTGTTQEARDAWFLGFTANYVAGVWMGYDDNTPLTGVTGGGLPAEIWRETMVRVHEGLPPVSLPMTVPPEPRRTAEREPDRRPERRRPPPANDLERAIEQLLGNIFR
ncbi:MAG: PBP1A family penicillin-binding protein [Paracoccaceae bacterium]|nr:PBP1A family penicillin-binding protein [Paracoccaceae bacterium]